MYTHRDVEALRCVALDPEEVPPWLSPDVPRRSEALRRPAEALLCDKRARGYRYEREEQHLRQLDRFLVRAGLDNEQLRGPRNAHDLGAGEENSYLTDQRQAMYMRALTPTSSFLFDSDARWRLRPPADRAIRTDCFWSLPLYEATEV